MKRLAAILLVLGCASCSPFIDFSSVASLVPPLHEAAAPQPVCVSAKLNACQREFNTYLNISDDAMVDWSNPYVLNRIILNQYKTLNGLLSVCFARQQFAACLGDQFDACMSVTRFVSAGESQNNAYAYVYMFKVMEFDCDGGLLQAGQKWDCITGIYTLQEPYLYNCSLAFNNAITANPNAYCPALNALQSCNRVLLSYCGSDISWWSCERTRISMAAAEVCPNDRCYVDITKQPTLMAGSSREENIKQILNRDSNHAGVVRNLAMKAKERESRQ